MVPLLHRSTIDLNLRLTASSGANHTKKQFVGHLVYYEEYQRIDEAF
jgi:hypothetical protein